MEGLALSLRARVLMLSLLERTRGLYSLLSIIRAHPNEVFRAVVRDSGISSMHAYARVIATLPIVGEQTIPDHR
jgi:hypothetical protein